MRKIFLWSLPLAAIFAFGCNNKTQVADNTEDIIFRKNLKIENRKLTPEVLWSMGRLSDAQVSTDGNTILYGVAYYDIPQNKSNRELFTVPVTGGIPTRLTTSANGEYSATWTPDGKRIGYLSAQSGSLQLWEMNVDGSNKTQVTNIDGGVDNFKYSPNGKRIMFTKDVKILESVKDIYPDLPKAGGKIITNLLYRHWDQWEDEFFSHVFYADYNNGVVGELKDIMPGEPYDSPLKPFGGMEEISWSPDGNYIAYGCKKLYGKDYAISTNSDIYLYNIKTGETKNLTEENKGYDRFPSFSNNGEFLAYTSQEHDGFEADQERLFIIDLKDFSKKRYLKDFEYSPSGIIWSNDDKELYFVVGIDATHQIYNYNFEEDKLSPVTQGIHDYHMVALANNTLIGTKVSMLMPEDIYSINPDSGEETQITFENKNILDQLDMPTVEKRWVTTTDNKQMLTWVVLPPNFDKTKKYPAILYCEGGPQSPLSQFWSYRWNFSIMASNDYIIVAPNRRGVLAMGQEWTNQISKDNAGQAMRDLLAAIDVVKQEPYVDETRLGAIGASFGGFSVYWLAGNHNKRFKAFIAHCGVFNSEMEFATTDESFFDYWEKGGAPWEKDNKVAQKSFAGSPHNFVDKWDTPILVVHGGLDFRIPYTQGMAAFNAAQLKGIPSEFLYFPQENHWVLSPQNGILWQRRFFNWLDTYLKK